MLGKQQQLEAAYFYVLHRGDLRAAFAGAEVEWPAFEARARAAFPALCEPLADLYGERADFLEQLVRIVQLATQSCRERPADLKRLDAARDSDPLWFQSNTMVGGVCYVDRFGGDLKGVRAQIPYFKELGLTYLHLMPLFACPAENSDGGYAVSSYREVRADLGTIDDLRGLAAELRASGISLVLDFIFNHTSNEHEWAGKAAAGQREFEDYYWIFPDRKMPDAYERTTREIFPDDHPGSFVQLPDGRWIWATFHHFQWDLNYSNPEVFRAMAGEMLFLANLGVDFLRMDAVAFIWKQLGTTCESLPQAHTLIRAFNALCRIAAPSLLFKSEAIVHPDEVVTYIAPGECQISYNPLLMALCWEALATRRVGLLAQALSRRQAIDPACAWVNYVRSHDDIGWTFADEDAAELGVIGFDHRRFLNAYYVNRYPGSFARGVPFQDNPRSGDCRIAGTCASLAGVEGGDAGGIDRVLLLYAIALSAGGVPLIYLGDEVGQLNDYSYARDPAHAGDSRWVNRPARPAALYAARHDAATSAGQIYTRLSRLIALRKATPALGGGRIADFETGVASVLGYQRPGEQSNVLVLANFGDSSCILPAPLFAAMPPRVEDLVSGEHMFLRNGLTLRAHQFVWLHFGNPQASAARA
jgi:amylosucrase